jgi:outer membrane lipoprotein-sorting protein
MVVLDALGFRRYGFAVMNILRRLPLRRLLLVCAAVVAVGASATALAFALGSGPVPPAKPLPEAVHDALTAAPVEGVTASVKLTDNLLEGASLASGGEAGELSQSPLLSGASGRLWIAKDGRVRLELQAEKGDTQVLYDGKTVTVYDASTNTLYRYTPPAAEEPSAAQAKVRLNGKIARLERRLSHNAHGNASSTQLVDKPNAKASDHETPSVAKIEEAISKLKQHVEVSGATPTDVAGQPAYTVRVSPKEGGSLIGGAELSWDAAHGVPLRAALYSSTSSSPVIELAASEVSYGPVASSVFEFTAPSNAKVEEVKLPGEHEGGQADSSGAHGHPNVTTHGHGIAAVAVVESKTKSGEKPLNLPEGLPKVHINGTTATELSTALGTLLSFERSGARYLLVGSVTPQAIEAVARGL